MKHTSAKGYVIVFALLLGMAFLNMFLSLLDLGSYKTFCIVSVACVQAFLLATYFMHLRESPRLTWVFVFSSFFFLVVLIVFVVCDNVGRNTQQRPRAWEIPAAVTMPATPAAPHAAK